MAVIMAKQNRLFRLAEQRAYLDLTVTLLTEQKTTKLIDLMEERRRDLPPYGTGTIPKRLLCSGS